MNTIVDNLGMYVIPEDADIYFSIKINSSNIWDISLYEDKLKALQHATRLIDRLNFTGIKADSINQTLEFPRLLVSEDNLGNTIYTPIDYTNIQIACAEIAYSLLSGVDVNKEIDKLYIESNSIALLKTTYNRTYIPNHFRAGIPSAIAWDYLMPYLQTSRSIKLNRVS